MSRVLTNNTSLAYSIESELGIASETWKRVEPNGIPTFGPEISTVARDPISKNRQRKKGTLVDLDSSVEIESDLTLEHMIDFIEGFVFSSATGGPAFTAVQAVAADPDHFVVVGDPGLSTDHLVFSRGFTQDANNGLHEVTAVTSPVAADAVLTITSSNNAQEGETVTIDGTEYTFTASVTDAYEVLIGADREASLDNLAAAIDVSGTAGTDYGTGTEEHPTVTADASDTSNGNLTVTAETAGAAGNDIAVATDMAEGSWDDTSLTGGSDGEIQVSGSDLVDETPATVDNATVETAGVRGATGDLEIDSDGNLISTALDFTTLDIIPGHAIHIGGDSDHRFSSSENFGFARVTVVETNKLTLDKKANAFVTDNGSGEEVDILFGRFIRNVPVDDTDYLERSFQFEAAWEGLADDGSDEYEYAKGNFCNELSVELPLTDKALFNPAFIGTDTDPVTGTRNTGAGSPLEPVQTEAFNTTADIARLRITETDETGLTTDFKSMTVTLNNNVNPEKVLSTLGARFMNNGIFMVDLETQVLFTNGDVTSAIRNNETVTMDFSLQNGDGGMFVDIPSMTLGDGSKELPVNETVLLNLTGMAFEDANLGTSIGVSLFPWLPD